MKACCRREWQDAEQAGDPADSGGFRVERKDAPEYCQEHGISITTVDYWRRKHNPKPKLMEVAIEPQRTGPGFSLVLANGRRIESSWEFVEADLLRLIHVAEA